MNNIIERLNHQLQRLDIPLLSDDTLLDIKNKLTLYISKYFKDKGEYFTLINSINTSPKNVLERDQSKNNLRSLITTLIEDINLGDNNLYVQTEEETKRILLKARKEADSELARIQKEAEKIQKMQEELQKDRDRLLAEEEKFNYFKSKLEIADKKLDFQQQAQNNIKNARLWASMATVFIGIFIWIICVNLGDSDVFSNIAKQVINGLPRKTFEVKDEVITKTIYFVF